jgi:hypothetical protein
VTRLSVRLVNSYVAGYGGFGRRRYRLDMYGAVRRKIPVHTWSSPLKYSGIENPGGPDFIVVVSEYSHLELIMLYRVGNKSSAPARLSVVERFEKRGARLGIASTYNGCGQRSCL